MKEYNESIIDVKNIIEDLSNKKDLLKSKSDAQILKKK